MYWSKNCAERMDFLMREVRLAYARKNPQPVFKVSSRYGHSEHTLCAQAWRLFYKVPINAYYQAVNAVKGKSPLKISIPFQRQSTQKMSKAIAWFGNYTKFHGDRLPHKSKVLLPFGLNCKQVYNLYKSEYRNATDILAYESFLRMTKKHYPYVAFKRKVSLIHI